MPSISTVAICNMALSHIGADSTIEDIDEDDAGAKACKTWFDWSRAQTLAAYDWNFARRRATLALHDDAAPDGDWTYRYALPTGLLKARYVVNPAGWTDNAVPFVLELSNDGSEQTILCDVDDAVMVYTFDQTDSSLWSPEFVDTLAWRLAASIAFQVTGNRAVVQDALKTFSAMLMQSAAINANEGVARGPREAEGIRARD